MGWLRWRDTWDLEDDGVRTLWLQYEANVSGVWDTTATAEANIQALRVLPSRLFSSGAFRLGDLTSNHDPFACIQEIMHGSEFSGCIYSLYFVDVYWLTSALPTSQQGAVEVWAL